MKNRKVLLIALVVGLSIYFVSNIHLMTNVGSELEAFMTETSE